MLHTSHLMLSSDLTVYNNSYNHLPISKFTTTIVNSTKEYFVAAIEISKGQSQQCQLTWYAFSGERTFL